MAAPAAETYAYDILLTHDPDEGTWAATVPSLPGCVAQGDSREEALDMIRGAIQLHVAAMLRDGAEVLDDSDSRVPEVVRVEVDAAVATVDPMSLVLKAQEIARTADWSARSGEVLQAVRDALRAHATNWLILDVTPEQADWVRSQLDVRDGMRVFSNLEFRAEHGQPRRGPVPSPPSLEHLGPARPESAT